MTIVATALSVISFGVPLQKVSDPPNCKKTFTVRMVERAVDATYGGTKDVTRRSVKNINRYIRCARHHKQRMLKRYLHTSIAAWKLRRNPPMSYALASYYSDHGGGACGVGDVQSGYRFASLILGCGAAVLFCYRQCVTAIMSDHGPYVGGRTFDLNVNLRNALGCPDLCSVRWRTTGG